MSIVTVLLFMPKMNDLEHLSCTMVSAGNQNRPSNIYLWLPYYKQIPNFELSIQN